MENSFPHHYATIFNENNTICYSDTEEIREAIKNDRPIPVSKDQFELINALTKLMLSG